MTRFDPNKQHKSAIDWSAIAFQTADDDKAAETVVVGAVVGAAIASVTTPVLGGVIACYFVIKGIQRSINADKNRKVIRETGCVAHILTDANFRAYKHQVGEESVIRELQFAQENGLAFSDDALDFYEDYLDSQERLPSRATQPSHFEPDNIALQTNTKIDYYDPTATSRIDILNEMTDRIGNSIVIGIPGSGKGMLVSNAIREAKRKYPALKVFVIDPKADPKEAGYFDCCDVVKCHPCMDAKPGTVAAWAESAFNDYVTYAQEHDRTLLIVDEGTMLGNKLSQAKSTLLVDKLTSYTSGGDSVGRNVWFLMQSPYVGSASLNLSTSSQMTTIVIAFSENIGALQAWKSAKVFKSLSLDEVSELIDNSETGRALYYGKTGKWYIMPTLTNYSGYDRDNRKFLPGHSALDAKKEDVDVVVEDEEVSGFDFNKALEALRTLKGKDWMKVGDARSSLKPLRKVTRDADDVRLIVSFLQKDGEAETKDGDLFRVINKPS